MKRAIKLILIFCICLLTSQVTVLGLEEPAKGSPVAETVNPQYDFEITVEGSEVVHDFIIINTGTSPLVIEKVKTG